MKKNIDEQMSRIKEMMGTMSQDFNEQGDMGQEIDPKIYDGMTSFDIMKANIILLRIFSYSNIKIPVEVYKEISDFMNMMSKKVKSMEEKNKPEPPSMEGMPF